MTVEENVKALIEKAAKAGESGDAMRFSQAAQNAGGAMCALKTKFGSEPTDAQIKHMVNRFLSWRLPSPWNPDGGISYTRPNYAPNIDATPTGTNLFDATQATAMVRHMIEGMSDAA